MAISKGDNITMSLVPEDQGYGKPPSTYANGKMMQNNDGTFNASRNALESAARTPIAELAGVRLGNKQVAGTFPVEIDPKNYGQIFESLFYGRFNSGGSTVTKAANTVTATKKYEVIIPVSGANQTKLEAVIGNAYYLRAFSSADLSHLVGVAILVSKTATELVFLHPNQREDTLNVESDTTISPVDNLRPSKQGLSFNAEETIYPEDGSEPSRFMTTGIVTTGMALELPSEGLITSSFSMIGADHIPSKQYQDFDQALANGSAAHTNVSAHSKFSPLVLQDSAILNAGSDILCEWLSGTINIENGAQAFFSGCSYKARGSFSGSFRVNVSYEALFESEDDYIAFEKEQTTQMFLRLKDRNTDQCIVLYIPQLFKTGYTRSGGRGLVSASVTGTAVLDAKAVNSLILARYANFA